jgi:hypothetical protein
VGNTYVSFTQSNTYIAPQYAGYIITITVPGIFTLQYTIQNTDYNQSVLSQNIVKAINALMIAGVSATISGTSVLINTTASITETPIEVITAPTYTKTLWSTCNLYKCLTYLIKKVLCLKKQKKVQPPYRNSEFSWSKFDERRYNCKEHVKGMRLERDELNRIMLLYTQFSMMNDVERWDYLPLGLNTNMVDFIFDKLNFITKRCSHCDEKFELYESGFRYLRASIYNPVTNTCNCNVSIQNVTLYTATVMSNGASTMAINFGSVVASCTIIFPENPVNGQTFSINSSYPITSLTLSSSYTIQNYAPGYFYGTPPIRYIFDSAQNKWLIN